MTPKAVICRDSFDANPSYGIGVGTWQTARAIEHWISDVLQFSRWVMQLVMVCAQHGLWGLGLIPFLLLLNGRRLRAEGRQRAAYNSKEGTATHV